MIERRFCKTIVSRLVEEARLSANWSARSVVAGAHQELRPSLLDEKNYVGLAGELAMCVYLTGDGERFWEGRRRRRESPWLGDGGTDLPPWRVDCKSSLMRYSQQPIAYRLLVPASEIHPDTAYVAAFVSQSFDEVTLAGWATTDEVERSFRATFPGKPYAIEVSRLRPMETLREHLDEQQSEG